MWRQMAIAVPLGLIALYRYVISPLTGATCRFTPSCSDYAAQALRMHGLFRGGWLALRRIVRCRPGGGCGIDEVPLSKDRL